MAMKISIITAAYNREAVIGDSVRSLYAQTFKEFEHLVVDGASVDNTLQVIKSESDDRTVAVSEPDKGVCDAFNKGLSRATGDIVGFLHSDDFFADENALDAVAGVFTDKECDLVFGDLDYVSSSDPSRVVRHWRAGVFSREALKYGWMPPHPTVFITRNLLKTIGQFDCNYKIACDYDFLMKCLTQEGIKVHYIPKTLVKMRLGGVSNGSFKRIFVKTLEDYQVIKRHKIGLFGAFPTLFLKNIRKVSQFYHKT
jgi:glycosyltransferase